MLVCIMVFSIILSGCLNAKSSDKWQENSFVAEVIGEESELLSEPLEAITEGKQTQMESIKITAGGKEFTAVLYNNEAAQSFAQALPLTLDMSELNGNEKYFYLDSGLPTEPEKPKRINSGDLMLYGSSCLVLFYESFSTSYSYTPIGTLDNPTGLAEVLGNGDITVSFELI